jgi:CBS domain containing-hemolysin-like protein
VCARARARLSCCYFTVLVDGKSKQNTQNILEETGRELSLCVVGINYVRVLFTLIIVVVVVIIIVSFMQGIYTRIPETNHVPREYVVVAILSFLFMVLVSLVPALALL